MNPSGGARDADCLAQKGGLTLVGFYQVERYSGCERQDQAWEAPSGAQVDGVVRKRVD